MRLENDNSNVNCSLPDIYPNLDGVAESASSQTEAGSKRPRTGSILKTKAPSTDELTLQTELSRLYIAQLLDDVISKAIYLSDSAHLETASTTPCGDLEIDAGTDDDAEELTIAVRKRLSKINEEYSKLSLPSDRDYRVAFNAETIQVPPSPDCSPHVPEQGNTDNLTTVNAVKDLNETLESLSPGLHPVNIVVSVNESDGTRSVSVTPLEADGERRQVGTNLSTEQEQNKPTRPQTQRTSGLIKTNNQSTSTSQKQTSVTRPPSKHQQSPRKSADKSKHSPDFECKQHNEPRQQSGSAIEAWLRRKMQIDRDRRKLENDKRLKEEEELWKKETQRRDHRERQHSTWLRSKTMQSRQEREMRHRQEIERLCFTVTHSKEQCEKAFKEWLQRKAKEEQKRAKEAKQRFHITQKLMRHARPSMSLSAVINKAEFYRILQAHELV